MLPSRPAANLPRRDTWMMSILLAIMLVIDIAAAITGLPDKAKASLFLMPATLVMIWTAYALTLRAAARRYAGNQSAVDKLARFMGGAVSLVGGLLTLEHVMVVGSFAWFGPVDPATLVRLFTVAIGVVLMIMYNWAPKATAGLPGGGFPGLGVFLSGGAMLRETAWVGVASGAAIVAFGLFGPGPGRMAQWIFVLTLAAPAVQIGLTLTRRKRG